MKARQLFTASLGLALFVLIVWMIMSDGDHERDGLQSDAFSNTLNEPASTELLDSEMNRNESEDKRIISENLYKNSQEPQSPARPSKPFNSLSSGTKPQIPARPPDIQTEEYVKKNRVLLDKISRNYQRILGKKKGN